MGFPVWIIAVVVAIVVVLSTIICYLLISRRRRTSPPAIDVVDTAEKAIGTTTTTTTTTHHPQKENIPAFTEPSQPQPKDTMSVDPSLSSSFEAEPHTPTNDAASLPPRRKSARKQEHDSTKINLPLPPPSASLFSDKMELSSDEAMELFDKYVNVDIDKSAAAATGGFTANLQQKAATLRSTMRQSLRRQKSTCKPSTPLQNLFDASGSGSETTSATGSTPSLVEKHPVPSIRTATTTDKPIAPALPTPTTPSTPVSRPLPQSPIHAAATDDDNDNGAMAEQAMDATAPEPAAADGAAMTAARRVIRSASRKSKTRSMLVNEDDVIKMFNPETVAAATAAATKTGSVRRLVRESIVNDKSASVSAVRARGPDSASGTSVRHLAARWNSHAMPAAAATVAGRVQQQGPRVSAQDLFESRQPTKTQQQQQQQKQPPPQKDNNGNVDNVRKMLQATWQTNLRESGSMASIVSSTEAAVAASNNHHSNNTMRQNPMLRGSTQPVPQESVLPTTPQLKSTAAQEKIEIEGTNFAMAGYHNQTWNAGRRSSTNKNTRPVFQKGQDTDDFFSTVGGRQSSRQRRVSPWMDDTATTNSNGGGNKTPAQRERDDYLTSYQRNQA